MKIKAVVLIILISVFQPLSVFAEEGASVSPGKNSGSMSTSAPGEENRNNLPLNKDSSSNSNALIYGGIGLAAVGAVLAIAGSGGESESSTDTAPAVTSTSAPPPVEEKEEKKESKPKVSTPKVTTPKDQNAPDSEPVGPDIRGGDWSGYLDLVHGVKENVTSSISQNGTHVVITTSSSQEYGRKFVGNINESGSIRVYDQKTGELWTTHNGPASDNTIDLYDYVDNYKALDRLYLSR